MQRFRLVIICTIIAIMMMTITSSVRVVPCEEFIDDEDLYLLMDDLGDGLSQVRISGWSLVNRQHTDIEELEYMVSQVMLHLNSTLEYKIFSAKKNNMRQVIAKFNMDGTEGRITYNNSVDSADNSLYETYAVIDINIASPFFERAEEIKSLMNEYFNNRGEEIHITSTYMTTSIGRLSKDEIYGISNTIFEKLGGHVTEGLEDISFISLTGYSPRLREGLETQNGTININMAARYNAYDNKSYLWLGVPIINAEY